MAPKQQLDKNAWEWARTTPPDRVTAGDIETAYRIHLAPCNRQTCKKNCVGNPNCLCNLGEKRWLTESVDDWLERFSANFDDIDMEREPNTFVGLENLGATCYINAFLQVWYHNRAFRTAVLKWQDPNDQEGMLAKSFTGPPTKEMLKPTSACGHLQLVFAQLHFGKRKSFRPELFAKSLNIDTSDQQDAQEFCQLFMSYLEMDAAMKTVIQSQFMGRDGYATRCKGCGSETFSDSTFYGLVVNIKGHKELSESLDEYFADTLLSEGNKYNCTRCGTGQDAVHAIRLHSVPAVLNIQLQRFNFENGHKKKLSSYFSFPETLDMSKYLPGAPAEDVIYNLFAVIMHCGNIASSGHYVTMLKDPVTGETYKFNDTEVEKIEDKKFNIANEEDGDEVRTKEKRPRTAKGFQTSRKAYMLVYCKQSSLTDVPFEEVSLDMLPYRVRTYIELDNKDLEAEIEVEKQKQARASNDAMKRSDEVTRLYDAMKRSYVERNRTEDCEWISTAWLSKWMSAEDSFSIPTVDNEKLLCPHKRLDPNRVHQAKLIRQDIGSMLSESYGHKLRLPCHQSMCSDCVVARCYLEFNRTAIANSEAEIITATKGLNLQPSALTYWVSKSAIRQWRSLAIAAVERAAVKFGFTLNQEDYVENAVSSSTGACSEPKSTSSSCQLQSMDTDECIRESASSSSHVSGSSSCSMTTADGGGNGDIRPDDQPTSTSALDNCSEQSDTEPTVAECSTSNGHTDESKPDAQQDDEDDGKRLFNAEVVCPEHGGLRLDPKTRFLVTRDIWQQLTQPFLREEYVEVLGTAPVCHLCENSNAEEKNLQTERKQLASKQRTALGDLYANRSRPSDNSDCVYIVSSNFVNEWKKFVRDAAKVQPVRDINNEILLCRHNKLCHNIMSQTDDDSEFAYLRPDEWQLVRQIFNVDIEICRRKVTMLSGVTEFVSTPEVCESCYLERCQEKYNEQFEYDNGAIFVAQVTEINTTTAHAESTSRADSSFMSSLSNNTEVSSSSDDIDMTDITGNEEGLQHNNVGSKRKQSTGVDLSYTDAKMPKLDSAQASTGPLRRSNRRHDKRKEKQLKVSSSQTLHDLKLQIARAFNVMKTDQHIYFNGVELTDDNLTLQQLRIPVNSRLDLKIDEAAGDRSIEDSSAEPAESEVERGFKGTLLATA